MRIYVISLPTALKRRKNTRVAFENASITFEFFNAIKPEQAMDQFVSVDSAQILLNAGRNMTPSEIACYASHKAMWQRCVDLDEPILILDDDVAPTIEWPSGLAALRTQLPVCGFVRLDPARKHRESLKFQHKGFNFIRLLRCPFGAHAYAITPGTAARFLAHSVNLSAPVDVFIKQFWCHGVPLYRQEPALITHREDAYNSTILGRDVGSRSVFQRLHRSIIKLIWAGRRGWFNVWN